MTVNAAPRADEPAVRLGVAFVPTQPPETLRTLATTAEAAGLDELWVWEDCFKQSGVASAGAALAWTERIRVGIGLLPAPLRSTAVTAMELATLARLFPGRFVPAVGHGVQEWMGQSGVRADSPLTLLREHTDALRRLLAGEEVTTSGRYVVLDKVRLDWPSERVPLVVGGVGPRTLALAGELGDGLILANALTPDGVRGAVEAAGTTAQATGRASEFPVYATLVAATGTDAQARLDAELPQWGAVPGTGIGAAGDARAIADGVLRLAAAGATAVAIQPLADEPDLEGFVRMLGREVRPLLAVS